MDAQEKCPRLSNEQEDKKQECVHKLDLLFYRLCIKYNGRHDILSDLTNILDYAKDMLEWVHEYDYKPSIPANGYRSMIRLTINMLKSGLASGDQDSDNEYIKLVKIFKDAIFLIQSLRSESIEQSKIEILNDDDSAPDAKPVLYSTPINMTVDLMTKFTDNADLFGVIFGKLEAFDKRPIVKYLTKITHYLMAIKTSKSYTGMVNAMVGVSPADITKVTSERYMSHNVSQVASMLSGGRGFFYETFLNVACNFGAYPSVIKTIFVPRQCKWIIDADIKRQHIGIKYQNNSSSSGSVRCKIYQELKNGATPDGKIVIFCHGGGFITNSPESHEVSCRLFCC